VAGIRSDNQGLDNGGSDNQGLDNRGLDNRGSDNQVPISPFVKVNPKPCQGEGIAGMHFISNSRQTDQLDSGELHFD
jgi:hypothetical protein